MKTVSIGDVSLAVEDRGRGVPLLFVHGFPLSHQMWTAQLDDLSPDFRVLAPDLRGFGRSPRGEPVGAGDDASPRALAMEQLADDLNALLAALEISEPIIFCGLSMGGYVAWQFWRKYAVRLRGMILCDTRAAADTDDARANRLRMAEGVGDWGSASVAAAMTPKLFGPTTYSEQPEIVEQIRESIATTDPQTIAAAQRGMAEREDMTAQLALIDTPSLLLCGEHDSLSPPEEMRQIAAAMPRAEFHEVASAGHMAPLEQPERVNESIRRFLASLKRDS